MPPQPHAGGMDKQIAEQSCRAMTDQKVKRSNWSLLLNIFSSEVINHEFFLGLFYYFQIKVDELLEKMMNDTDVKEASRGAIRKMNRLGKEQM